VAQTHYRAFTVDHTKVPSTQTSFPVVISGTYSWAASIANGGRAVNGNNGFDLRAYSDTGLSIALTYQLRSYNATTGAFNMVVLVASLSSSVDTVIYIGLGDAALTTDGSSTGVWDSNFKAVYALGNGTTLSLADSTSNGNTLTNVNTVTATSGVAGGMGAASFNGTTQALDISGAPVATEPITIEALFNPNEGTTTAAIAGVAISSAANVHLRELTKRPSSTQRATQAGTTGVNLDAAASSYTASAWNYGAATFTSLSSRAIHPNGAAKTTSATVIGSASNSDRFGIGARFSNGTLASFFAGSIGEVRISNSTRADDWIKTTDANLRGIATFYSVGTEQVAGAGNTAPVAAITGPVASGGSTSAVYGNSVTFTGTGTDAEDGTLTGASLVWSSNLQGTLGTGVSLSLSTLLAGVHTITLTATDSAAATNTKTITLTVTSTVQDAWQTFINANGNDSAWLGCADFRVNVTDDGTTKASQWDDVRGPGTGKLVPLVQATQSKRYAITAGGLTGTAAAQSHMISALDSRLTMDQSAALHFFIVAKSPSGSSYLFTMSQDPTDTTSQPYESFATGASNYVHQGNTGGGGTTNLFTVDSGTAFGATVRTAIMGRSQLVSGASGAYCYNLQIRGRQTSRRQVLPIASAAASGMKLAIGRWGTTYADWTVLGFGITNQTLSKTLCDNIDTFCATQFSATADLTKNGTLIWEGVSTNRAHNSTHPAPKGGDVVANDGSTGDWYLCQRAVTGFGTFASIGYDDGVPRVNTAANSRYFVDQSAIFASHHAIDIDTRRNGLHLYCTGFQGSALTVSPYNLAGGDTTFITNFSAFVAVLYAAGYKIIGETINDLSNWYTTGTLNQAGTNALAINTWMRTTFLGLPGVIGLFDIEGSTGNHYMINRVVRGGGATLAYTDTSWIDGTGHPTDAGQVLRGQVMRTFFEANTSLLVPSASTGGTHRRSHGRRRFV
jgi:hypothetical protein